MFLCNRPDLGSPQHALIERLLPEYEAIKAQRRAAPRDRRKELKARLHAVEAQLHDALGGEAEVPTPSGYVVVREFKVWLTGDVDQEAADEWIEAFPEWARGTTRPRSRKRFLAECLNDGLHPQKEVFAYDYRRSVTVRKVPGDPQATHEALERQAAEWADEQRRWASLPPF